MSWAEDTVKQDLKNPFSPYYLGQPTVTEEIRRYLNRTGRVGGGYYNTNFLGANKKYFLAQPQSDSFEIMSKAKQRAKTKNIIQLAGAGVASILSFFLLRKIPGVSTLASMAWKGTSAVVGGAFKYGWKGFTWIFKK